MKTKIQSALCAVTMLACVAGQFTAHAGSPPEILSVTASQRAGTKLVDINYPIRDFDSTSVNIGILVSKDSGATWTVPASTFTGGGAPGVNKPVIANFVIKSAVWDAGADWDGHFTTNCRVRVLANDAGLAFIPAGSFNRGDNLDGLSDAPVYSVTVSAFYMDAKLVTGGQWNVVVEGYAQTHGYDLASAAQLGPSTAPAFKAASHPVYYVDWYQAVKWCNAHSEMEGATPVYYTDAGFTTVYKIGDVAPYVKPGVNGYRLPTEAEWEKAARGGLSGKRFPWGDTITHSEANYNSSASYTYDTSPTRGYHPTYDVSPTPYTSPVASFAANAYGLYDMAGNVFAWCWDRYGSAYYASGQTDPQRTEFGELSCVAGRLVELQRQLRAVCGSQPQLAGGRRPHRWLSVCEGALVFDLLNSYPLDEVLV